MWLTSAGRQLTSRQLIRCQLVAATLRAAKPAAGRRRLSLLRERAFVAGQWTTAADGRTYDVINPATGDVIAAVPDLGPAEVETAAAAAAAAQRSWGLTAPLVRSQLLQRLHRLMLEHAEELARLITAEQGKPLAEARAEVAYAAGYVDWYAGEARRLYGELTDAAPNKETLTILQPAGVAALITPWNFPLAMLTRKLSAALACGCAALAKPAPDTPLSALALAALAERAGLPAAVLAVLTASVAGTPAVGAALCADRRLAVLSFTGSTAVGKLLYQQCASTVKKLSLELGGNSPFIVFDSADVAKAVTGCMQSKFRNAGQTCISTNRILVQAGVYDQFVSALSVAMETQLTVGEGTQDGVNMGPLINDAQLAKVAGLVEQSVRQGATVQMGGHVHQLGGRFYAPTLLTDVTCDMSCFREEVFGPVAGVARFETEEQALEMANDTDAGLASYIYTENISQAWRVSRRLQFGIVGVNDGAVSQPEAPFGGVKQSGLGREGSRHGVDDYTELKYICIGTA